MVITFLQALNLLARQHPLLAHERRRFDEEDGDLHGGNGKHILFCLRTCSRCTKALLQICPCLVERRPAIWIATTHLSELAQRLDARGGIRLESSAPRDRGFADIANKFDGSIDREREARLGREGDSASSPRCWLSSLSSSSSSSAASSPLFPARSLANPQRYRDRPPRHGGSRHRSGHRPRLLRGYVPAD